MVCQYHRIKVAGYFHLCTILVVLEKFVTLALMSTEGASDKLFIRH